MRFPSSPCARCAPRLLTAAFHRITGAGSADASGQLFQRRVTQESAPAAWARRADGGDADAAAAGGRLLQGSVDQNLEARPSALHSEP